jgi:hypothetical protein
MKTNKRKTETAGRYRTPDGKAMIAWELRPTETGPEFSAFGEYDGGMGQCIDGIAAAYPEDRAVQRIAAVWREWHLNGLTAGTPEQEAHLKARRAAHPGEFNAAPFNGDHYAWAVATLKAAGLHVVQLAPGHGLQATGGFEQIFDPRTHNLIYTYGTRWIHRPIPASMLAEIESWTDFSRADSRTLGECKAEEFLTRHGIALRLVRGSGRAPWHVAGKPDGQHYRVTLAGEGRSLTFDFWGSVNDREAGRDPSPYDILACVSSDLTTPRTFAEFCSEYGSDANDPESRDTFRRAHVHAIKLREFFPRKERTELEGIR